MLVLEIDDIRGLMVNNDIIREINADISLRKSKYGLYLFYKTEKDSKPQFISLKKMKENVETCDKSVIIEYVNANKK